MRPALASIKGGIVMIETTIKILQRYGYVYAQGLAGTLCLAGITIVAGTIIGTALALFRMSKIKPLQWFVKGYVWVLRGTPSLQQRKEEALEAAAYQGTGWYSWYYDRGSVEERLVESRASGS